MSTSIQQWVQVVRKWDAPLIQFAALADQHDNVHAGLPPTILLAPEPEVSEFYKDILIPGGPQGDSGVDLFIPSVMTSYKRVELIDLQVRARCWDAQKECFVAMWQVPRSSIYKSGVSMANSPGTIDPRYVGHIKVPLRVHEESVRLDRGLSLTQLVAPGMEPALVIVVRPDHPAFAPTLRGEGGFGSTGNTGGITAAN